MSRHDMLKTLSGKFEMQKIGTRLGLGIGVLLALCVTIGLVSYMQTYKVSERIKDITEVKEPVNSAVYELENNLIETGFAVLGYLSQGDSTLLQIFQRNDERLQPLQERYLAVSNGSQNGEIDSKLEQALVHFRTLAREQIELKGQQTGAMTDLLRSLNHMDALLSGKIQASIKPEDPLAFRRLQAALEMKNNASAITRGLEGFILTGNPQHESHVLSAEKEFERYFHAYQYLLISSEEKEWSAQLRRLADRSLGLAKQIIGLEKVRIRKLGEFVATRRELDSILNGQIQLQTGLGLAEAKTDVLKAGDTANTTILIMLLLALTFGVYTGILTTKSLTAPIQKLASVMNAIAGGDYSQRADITAGAELRSLSSSFNQMTGRLVRANQELRAEIQERQRAEDARRATEQRLREAERQRSADLRRFAVSVQRAQEEERQRISRELHDDICQRLTGMKLRSEVLEGVVQARNKRAQKEVRGFSKELDQTIVEVRRLSSNLRPSVLDDFGLVTALRLLSKDFGKLHRINTTLNTGNAALDDLDPDLEIALYRIAQEAFSNVSKHAKASNLTLNLHRQNGAVTLTVEDDGTGFNNEEQGRPLTNSHGLGLISMRERADLLGGSFHVNSAPGKGTSINVTIPLEA